MVKREYSDQFHLQDDKQIALKLIPENLSYWICTNDPVDKSFILEKTFMNKKQYEDIELLKKIANGH